MNKKGSKMKTKKLLSLFFASVIFLFTFSSLYSEETKDPIAVRQLKIKITSPKAGGTLKGKVQILWEVTESCYPLNKEQNQTQNPTTKDHYVVQYFVDYELVGENTSDDPPFELDTKQFKNGIHTITINVADEHPHVATTGVKVRIKN